MLRWLVVFVCACTPLTLSERSAALEEVVLDAVPSFDVEPLIDAVLPDAPVDSPVEGPPDAPGIDAPGIDAPGIDAPGIDAPGIDAPGIDAPGIDAAGIDAAGIDAAGIDAAVTDAAVTDAAVDAGLDAPPPSIDAPPLVGVDNDRYDNTSFYACATGPGGSGLLIPLAALLVAIRRRRGVGRIRR